MLAIGPCLAQTLPPTLRLTMIQLLPVLVYGLARVPIPSLKVAKKTQIDQSWSPKSNPFCMHFAVDNAHCQSMRQNQPVATKTVG